VLRCVSVSLCEWLVVMMISVMIIAVLFVLGN
jgi:hypothetical protein